MKLATEYNFTGPTQSYAPGYDPTKANLGQWIVQKSGPNATDNYAGPFPMVVARLSDQIANYTSSFVQVIDAGAGTHWVFVGDASASGATRQVCLYTFNTATQAWGFKGLVTLTFPASSGNATMVAFRVVRHLYTTGTVAVSGTAVTGTGTAWKTAGYSSGARIGFGSTDPTQIATWYYIATGLTTPIANDYAITLNGTGPTTAIPAGTPYVIDELRLYSVNTNGTATNGGLFAAKGVIFEDFTTAGTTISAATTMDNVKAVYWLADASTVTNTTGSGLCLGTQSDTSQFAYVPNQDTALAVSIFKYDVRKSLGTPSSGKSTGAFIAHTGVVNLGYTPGTAQSVTLATAGHGPGLGVSSIYGVAGSRIYRVPESEVLSGNLNFIADSMLENPTGGNDTYSITGNLLSISYDSTLDRFLVTTGSGNKHYVTKYDTSGAQMDRVMLSTNTQTDLVQSPSGLQPYPSISGSMNFTSKNGITYCCRASVAAAYSQIYAIALGADWDFASGANAAGVVNTALQNRLITPALATPNCTAFHRLSVSSSAVLGSANFGIQPGPYRVYYRTCGIDDDSGVWTLISDNGNLSGVLPDENIQFMFEFKIIGQTSVPAKIYGLTCTYEDNSTDNHFQSSSSLVNLSKKQFVWRFATPFNNTVPTLTVKYFDAVTNNLILTDNTAAPTNGVFQKTTDGTTWIPYNTLDLTAGNTSTYIQYTPNSLPDNLRVKAVLQQSTIGSSAVPLVVANFTANNTSAALTPANPSLTVSFTDLSLNGPTNWAWNFGDGVGTSNQQNPTYTYVKSGNYTITLTASSLNGGSNTMTKTNYITVTDVLDNGPRWGWGNDPLAEVVNHGEGPFWSGGAGTQPNVTNRIPVLVKSPNNVLLFFWESRSAIAADSDSFAVRMKRSTDFGVTWSAAVDIINYAGCVIGSSSYLTDSTYVGLGGVVSDNIGLDGSSRKSVTLIFEIHSPTLYAGGNVDAFSVYYVRSYDDGVSWAGSSDISQSPPLLYSDCVNITTNINNSATTYSIHDITSNLVTLNAPVTWASGQEFAFITTGTLPTGITPYGPNGVSNGTGSINGCVADGGLVEIQTSAAHNLYTGAYLNIQNVGGVVEANGTFYITVVDGTHFTLNGTTFSTGPYTTGGTWTSVNNIGYFACMKSPTTLKVYRNFTDALTDTGSNQVVISDTSGSGSGVHSIVLRYHWLRGTGTGFQFSSNSSTPGRLVIPMDHRTAGCASDPNNVSYSHLIKSDDGGMTWSLLGGITENPDPSIYNGGTNEATVIETTIKDRVLLNTRSVATTKDYRAQAVSTDGGVTWSTAQHNPSAADSKVTPTWCSLIRLGGNTLCLAVPNDLLANDRKFMTFWTSQDEGMTWTKRRTISYRYNAYNSSVPLSTQHALMILETGLDAAPQSGSFSILNGAYQAITPFIYNLTWLLGSQTTYSDYFFNEFASGVTASPFGPNIIDYGGILNARACVRPVMTYTPSYTSTGIALTGNGGSICLTPEIDTGCFEFQPNSGESMTWEIEATLASDGVIISSLTNSKGFQMESSGGFLKGTVADGTHTVTVTGSTTTINDSTRRIYAMVREYNHSLKLYVNGVLEAQIADQTTGDLRQGAPNNGSLGLGVYIGNAPLIRLYTISGNTITLSVAPGWATATPVIFVTDGQMPIGLTAGTVYYVYMPSPTTMTVWPTITDANNHTANQVTFTVASGSVSDPSNNFSYYYAVNLNNNVYVTTTTSLTGTIHSARISRAAVAPNALQVVNRTKTTPHQFRNYTPATPPTWTPANLGSLVTWLDATYDGGESVFADAYFSLTYPLPYPDGSPVRSCRDLGPNRYFWNTGDYRVIFRKAANGNVGPCFQHYYDSVAMSNSYLQLQRNAITTFDFIQSTGHWTVAFTVMFNSSAGGGNQTVLDTTYNGNISANAGIQIWLDNTRKMNIGIGPGTLFNNYQWGTAFSYGTWYFMMFVGSGLAPVNFYHTPLTGSFNPGYTPASCTTELVTGINVTGITGTSMTGAGIPMMFAARGDRSSPCDAYFKNVVICNASLGSTEANELAHFSVQA